MLRASSAHRSARIVVNTPRTSLTHGYLWHSQRTVCCVCMPPNAQLPLAHSHLHVTALSIAALLEARTPAALARRIVRRSPHIARRAAPRRCYAAPFPSQAP